MFLPEVQLVCSLPVPAATHGYLTLLSASIVNQVVNKFLTRLPPARSDLKEPEMSLVDRMRIALDQLAEFRDDPSISERDPASPLSFCCVTEEVRKSQEELYQIYAEGVQTALSPLAPDGRPLRKYVTLPPLSGRYGHGCLANNVLTADIPGSPNAKTNTGWTRVPTGFHTRVRILCSPSASSHPYVHRLRLVSSSCPCTLIAHCTSPQTPSS